MFRRLLRIWLHHLDQQLYRAAAMRTCYKRFRVLSTLRISSQESRMRSATKKNASLASSYEVALEIAKQKQSRTIGEMLIKPCMLKMVKLVLGEDSEMKMRQISLSNDTIQRQISEISGALTEQVLNEIKASPLFSIQVDESTDVSSCSQLLAFARYIHAGDIKEELLFCVALEATATGEDVMEIIDLFFKTQGLEWKNVCSVSKDGASDMLGRMSSMQTKLKEFAPQAKVIHCMFHRYALANKTLPALLQDVLDSVIEMVNCIKSEDPESCLSKELCKDMNPDHEVLFSDTAARWLSNGNIVTRVFELKDEIEMFLIVKGRDNLAIKFSYGGWLRRLAYLVDILEQLDKLSSRLRRKETHVLNFQDNLQAFVAKLRNWRSKVNLGNIAMFETFCSTVENTLNGELDADQKNDVIKHLTSLENEFQCYLPELMKGDAALIRNPLQFLDLRCDPSTHNLFKQKSVTQFWCAMYNLCPDIAKFVVRVLLPFTSTYLCESGFSTLLHMNTKSRNRLNFEDDMRLALTNTQL